MSLHKRRLLDLSVTLDNNPYTDPPPLLPKIDYMDHQQGWPEMAAMFPGLRKEDLPGDESWAAERLQITTHSGTHMDAPWHYASTTDGGKPAFGIDELPLEWCLQPGVKLDFRHLPDGHVVTAEQVESELARIGHALQPLDIVLVNTRAGSLFGQPLPGRWRGHGSRSHAVPVGARGEGGRYGCLELGCTVQVHPRAFQRHG